MLAAASVVAFGPALVLEYVPTTKVDVRDVSSAGSRAGRVRRCRHTRGWGSEGIGCVTLDLALVELFDFVWVPPSFAQQPPPHTRMREASHRLLGSHEKNKFQQLSVFFLLRRGWRRLRDWCVGAVPRSIIARKRGHAVGWRG